MNSSNDKKEQTPLELAKFILQLAGNEERVEVELAREVVRLSSLMPSHVAAHYSDADIRRMWRAAGGDFHGPNVETATMPEANLFRWLREFADVAVKQATVTPSSTGDRKNTPIEALLKSYEDEGCDHSRLDWVAHAAMRYMQTMEDSQVRCLLYVLAKAAQDGTLVRSASGAQSDLEVLATVVRTGMAPPEGHQWTDDVYRKTAMRAVELHARTVPPHRSGGARPGQGRGEKP